MKADGWAGRASCRDVEEKERYARIGFKRELFGNLGWRDFVYSIVSTDKITQLLQSCTLLRLVIFVHSPILCAPIRIVQVNILLARGRLGGASLVVV